ncbi:MAG: NAD(P)-dependent oxidoreductase [Microbacteriaceae bacterium]|nr:NAD(P)-dependent oxidoreductase [Microbacteriaceae bacterium]
MAWIPERAEGESKERVAFIGLGNMGSPMTTRLVAAGHSVSGFDVSAAARARFAEHGGAPADSAVAAVADAAVVILMLPNSDVVDAVVAEMLPHVRAGALLVDMSSSEPLRTRALAETVAAGGARLIDAPVSGGVKGATAGTLAIMVGGPAESFAEVSELLSALGKPTHVGAIGAGHALKAINNLMSAIHLWGSSEAMLTGIAFGLDPEVMLEVINASSGRSGSTQLKWPSFIVPETYDSGFALALMLKDMRIATSLATELGIPHELGDEAVAHWTRASADLGAGADHTEVARWLRERGSSAPEGRVETKERG